MFFFRFTHTPCCSPCALLFFFFPLCRQPTGIWNSLITYGGRRGIYGDLAKLASSPYRDLALAKNRLGIGFTPEATEMIPSQFDIAMEAGWRTSPPDPSAWLQAWAVRRYGAVSPSLAAAHAILEAAAYNSAIDTASLEETRVLLLLALLVQNYKD